jgi:drug/metabolite transporter (DMT)-like permease
MATFRSQADADANAPAGSDVDRRGRGTGIGLVLAVVSSLCFGTSGAFATSLIRAGWSPAAAVTIRITIAALILTVPALIALRGRWNLLRRNIVLVTAYGLVAVAGCQVFYFTAVSYVSVGVALLLEYLGVILIVGWLWLRHGQRPKRLTVIGSVSAIAGLVLVLDIGGSSVNPLGVFWGLAAAVGLAVYFVLSARTDDQLPPIAMAWAGMAIGAVVLFLAGLVGIVPMDFAFVDVTFLNAQVSWLVPVIGLSLVAAAVAYVAGISAARRLGAKLASFVGLTEVLFAVLIAWLTLGQAPVGVQLVGGALILVGVAAVRLDELRAGDDVVR